MLPHRMMDYTSWDQMFLPLNIWVIYLDDMQAGHATHNACISEVPDIIRIWIKVGTYTPPPPFSPFMAEIFVLTKNANLKVAFYGRTICIRKELFLQLKFF